MPSSELVLPPRDYFGPTDCYNFPKDFVFGVAGSAAQIEGAIGLDGRSPSLLEKLVPDSKPKDYVTNENYFLYKQDIQRLAAMGVEYYSFTIPWTRILPFALPGTPVNQQGIDHYNDLIDTVLDAGMTVRNPRYLDIWLLNYSFLTITAASGYNAPFRQPINVCSQRQHHETPGYWLQQCRISK